MWFCAVAAALTVRGVEIPTAPNVTESSCMLTDAFLAAAQMRGDRLTLGRMQNFQTMVSTLLFTNLTLEQTKAILVPRVLDPNPLYYLPLTGPWKTLDIFIEYWWLANPVKSGGYVISLSRPGGMWCMTSDPDWLVFRTPSIAAFRQTPAALAMFNTSSAASVAATLPQLVASSDVQVMGSLVHMVRFNAGTPVVNYDEFDVTINIARAFAAYRSDFASQCRQIQRWCTGANQVYASHEQCTLFMSSLPPTSCFPELFLSNSSSCRFLHLSLLPIAPDVHCNHVSPQSMYCARPPQADCRYPNLTDSTPCVTWSCPAEFRTACTPTLNDGAPCAMGPLGEGQCLRGVCAPRTAHVVSLGCRKGVCKHEELRRRLAARGVPAALNCVPCKRAKDTWRQEGTELVITMPPTATAADIAALREEIAAMGLNITSCINDICDDATPSIPLIPVVPVVPASTGKGSKKGLLGLLGLLGIIPLAICLLCFTSLLCRRKRKAAPVQFQTVPIPAATLCPLPGPVPTAHGMGVPTAHGMGVVYSAGF